MSSLAFLSPLIPSPLRRLTRPAHLTVTTRRDHTHRHHARLEILSFNIRHPNVLDGLHCWQNRRAVALEVIRSNGGADLVGLQEAMPGQLRELQHHLGHYGFVGCGRADGASRGEHAAILYNKKSLHPLDHGTFWFSDTPDTPDTPGSAHWGNTYVRICTWGRFLNLASNQAFWLYNSHWDHKFPVARANSARLLASRIACRSHPEEPVLLTGDFNCEETSEPIQFLTGTAGGKFTDLFRAARPDLPHGETATYHSFTGRPRGGRIDHILASPGTRVHSAEIIRHQRRGIWPSDHFPIRCQVELDSAPRHHATFAGR